MVIGKIESSKLKGRKMSIFDSYENNSNDVLDRSEDINYSYCDPEEANSPTLYSSAQSVNIKIYIFIIAVFLVVISVRLFQIQIVKGRDNALMAKTNSMRQIIIQPRRGNILDTRGVWLTRNNATFNITLDSSFVPKKKLDREVMIGSVALILGLDDQARQNLIKQIESNYFFASQKIIVKSDIKRDDALVLTEKLKEIPGVEVGVVTIRQYNTPTNGLSHILGYIGKVNQADIATNQYLSDDYVGKSGLEFSYDKELRGVDGIDQALVDSKGKILRVTSDHAQAAVNGDNLVLKLDLKLQNIMFNELSVGLEKAGLKSGVAIAMDPRDGGIIGAVSIPAYDNNLFSGGISEEAYSNLINDPSKPMFNRITQGTYPSGSTIKPFVAATGLKEGVITENTVIDTPPEITVGQWKFPNWQKIFISNVDVKTAIANSNDIFFYAVGGGYDKISGLGVARLATGLELFGFGRKTGVDIPGEVAGLVPNEKWKKSYTKEPWYIGDTYHFAIGQGDLLVTPLQLASALSTVANGGVMYQPHFVSRITSESGETLRTVEPKVIKQDFIDKNIIRIVREGMRQTVTNGSGRQLNTLPIEVAGKTGTAQLGLGNEYLHSWFECFAPYNNPTIALVVLGEKGSQENEGHTTALPISKAILEQYFSPDFVK
jgi:penicillin-binding protein 2